MTDEARPFFLLRVVRHSGRDGREGMKEVIAEKLKAMQENLRKAYTLEAVHTDAPSPYEEGEVF